MAYGRFPRRGATVGDHYLRRRHIRRLQARQRLLLTHLHNLRPVCRFFVDSHVGGFFRSRTPAKVRAKDNTLPMSEGQGHRRPSIPSQWDVAQRTERPWVSRNLRKSGGDMSITTRRSLRDVNGFSTEKRVKRPNKTFEGADIR